jgi:hypothetical protein
MHKFRVEMTGPNRGKVFVNDEQLTGVKEIEFSASVDAMPMLKLTFNAPDVVVEGYACVTAIGDTEHRFVKVA